MNTTSFQGSNYSHFQQTQILGTSGLKILDGEDLSKTLFIKSVWRSKKITATSG
jgi:hypothetical protein